MSTTTRRLAAWAALAAVALVAAHWLDPWAATSLRWPAANDRDWGRALRILGFAPTWGIVALAFLLESRGEPAERARLLRLTAATVVAAVVIGGLGAEGLKLILRRLRPADEFTGYVFRAFADAPFSTKRLGLPSSHAMVAFSAVAAIGWRYPRVAPLLYLLAAGSGLTRVFGHAHYLSDVVAGGIGGTITGVAVAARLDRRSIG